MTSTRPLILQLKLAIPLFTRNINCWISAVTKTHRKVYLNKYNTILQYPDGSTINIRYHEPVGVIQLPIDLRTLSEEERKRKIIERQPVVKVKVQGEDDIEIDTFDENRYLK